MKSANDGVLEEDSVLAVRMGAENVQRLHVVCRAINAIGGNDLVVMELWCGSEGTSLIAGRRSA